MLEAMTKPLVHLQLSPAPLLTACGRVSDLNTRDPLAVTCPRCIARMEAQPA